MPDSGADQYSIEIKNLRTGETVILTSVDMTEQEKSVVVRQLLRLSGAPAALWIEDEEPKSRSEGAEEAMASMAVRWRAHAERLWRPPKPTSKVTAVVPSRRPKVLSRLRDRPASSSSLPTEEQLASAGAPGAGSDLLVRLLCFGSAVSLAS